MKRLCILGSTGSIGRQAIEVAGAYPDRFRITALSTRSNVELIGTQAVRHRPEAVAVADEEAAERLRPIMPAGMELLSGPSSLAELAARESSDVVVNGVVGFAGLDSTLSALKAGKTLALANKESMVVGGDLVLQALEGGGASLVPVDSEHSAIYQCLAGERRSDVARLVLTGSGGPFRGRDRASLESVTVADALAHPTWSMGPKITIDSATMMNKGLEIIEAHYLFGIDYDRIEVMIQPQSIVHSMVEFVDGSVKAQLGLPDMRLPILYALTQPQRLPTALPRVDLPGLGALTFESPDEETFPALRVAGEAGRRGRTYPAVLNAANEVAVEAFLGGHIGYLDIVSVIEQTLDEHSPEDASSVERLRAADGWARETAKRLAGKRESAGNDRGGN